MDEGNGGLVIIVNEKQLTIFTSPVNIPMPPSLRATIKDCPYIRS